MQKSIEKPTFSSRLVRIAVNVTPILLALGCAFAFGQKAPPSGAGVAPPVLLYKPGTEITMGAEIANPLTAYDSYADPKPFEGVTPNQTSGCKNLEVWEPVVVSRIHWNSLTSPLLASSATGVLAIAADLNCLKLGRPAHIAELHAPAGIMTTLGWFMPTGIAVERPEFASQEDRLRTSAGLLGYKGAVVFVTGRVIYYDRSTTGRRYAPRMLGARVITRRQMETAIQDGAQIIDIRSKKQFSAAHVKGAVHVPYTAGARMKIFDEYANYVKAGDAFDIRRINQDKQKPVILMSEGPYSDNLFRAAVVLRSEGWKQIYLFYEGFNYFSRMLWKPPAGSGLFETIVDTRFFDSYRKIRGAIVVDVRSESEFAEGHIEGALNYPYQERDDIRMRRPGLSGDLLRQYGDTMKQDPPLGNFNSLLFVGRDQYDWRSYKAALIAKSLGYKNIYWFRGGFDLWEASHYDDEAGYPIVRSVKAP